MIIGEKLVVSKFQLFKGKQTNSSVQEEWVVMLFWDLLGQGCSELE